VSTALISVEGVLGDHSPVHGFYPIAGGVRLAKALRSQYQVILSTIQADGNSVEFWLKINGMTRPTFYEDLLSRLSGWADLSDTELRAQHASVLRAAGSNVDLVISADPQAILKISQLGMPCLLFADPQYRWAEYRPDYKRLPRAWQDIDDEMVRQRELRATDPRLNEISEMEDV
jgi:hypothetical protein